MPRVHLRLAAVGAAFMLSCGRQSAEQHRGEGSAAPPDTLDPRAGAVLPIARGPEVTNACTRQSPQAVTGYFIPTEIQIAELEEHLPAALHQQRERRTSQPPVGYYYRQYIGLVRSGGKRTIYVNAFPRRHLEHLNLVARTLPDWEAGADSVAWRQFPVLACDGGSAYWSVEFDPEASTFRQFHFNDTA